MEIKLLGSGASEESQRSDRKELLCIGVREVFSKVGCRKVKARKESG